MRNLLRALRRLLDRWLPAHNRGKRARRRPTLLGSEALTRHEITAIPTEQLNEWRERHQAILRHAEDGTVYVSDHWRYSTRMQLRRVESELSRRGVDIYCARCGRIIVVSDATGLCVYCAR